MATPLLRLTRLEEPGATQVWVKLETLSPTASAWDRVAEPLLASVPQGAPLVLASMGELAIALAGPALRKGHALTVVLPAGASHERQATLRGHGVRLVLSDGNAHFQGARERARALHAEAPGSALLGEDTFALAALFQRTLGAEWAGELAAAGAGADALVLGVGTGATLAGVGRAFREHHPACALVPVAPAQSPHHLQGLGLSVPTPTLAGLSLSGWERVEEREAHALRDRLARQEALLVSLSSAAQLAAALRWARAHGPRVQVHTLAVSTGEREFSLEAHFA